MQSNKEDHPKYWLHFKRGLGLFVAGAILIMAGNYLWYWLQIPGLILLLISMPYTASGYFGILKSRIKALKSQRHRAPKD